MSDQQERIARYQKIVRTVKLNTHRESKPVMTVNSLKTTCCSHGDMAVEDFNSHLQAAVDNQELVQGNGYVFAVGHTDKSDAIEYVLKRETEPREFIARVNQL